MGRIPLELVLLMTCFCNAKGDICYSRAWGIAEEHLSTHVSDAAPECKCHGLAGKQPHLVKQGGKKKNHLSSLQNNWAQAIRGSCLHLW